MAEVSQIVSPILKAVIGKLGSRLWNEVELLWSVKNDFEELQELLSTVADVLDDAERRSISSRALSNWLRRLKDVTFDVDDVVDEFHTEALRQRLRSDNCVDGMVCAFFSANNPVVFYFKMAHKIKDVRKRFNDIAQLRRDFHLIEGSFSSESIIGRETYSHVNESKIHGRNDDKDKIIHFLLDVDNDRDVSVLPIVGLGGVGKTTLAQLVYNDKRVNNCFELRMWVCASIDFDVKRIAKTITERITKEKCTSLDLETVQQLFRQQLKEKKFLLVLDDIWNENVREWERLKSLLEGGRVGSKIIVTTRSSTVAAIMGTVDIPHRLNVLSDDDCWILFKHRAFRFAREENPKLVEIGKEIVSKCGGLPLAAVALGSLMTTKHGEIEWLGVKNSEIWRLKEDEVGIIPALKLSYDYLPPHLKHCFAYCSLFPKGSTIDRLKLIQLWIAEGFIPMLDEGMLAEDVGNQYFNSLLWGSFFQEEERNDFGDIVSCTMHDLMHDLACFISHGESFNIQVGRDGSIDRHRCRYVSVASTSDGKISSATIKLACEVKLLRSLLLSDLSGESWRKSMEKSSLNSIPNLLYLRALDLSYSSVEELPSAIGKLKHLRFLDLSETHIQVLPNSITSLYNLQTLKLTGCMELRELPEGSRNMSNLRHLDIWRCNKLTCMPHGLGRLRSLQTLPLFIVGEEPGRTIVELQYLDLIRGKLRIQHLKKVNNPIEAMEARLSTKTNLQQLDLSWVYYLRASASLEPQVQPRANVDADILENLRPHANLKSLKIENYSGNRFPSWLMKIDPSSSFPCMQELWLQNLKKCESLGSLGLLPSLKSLFISGMDGVKSLGKELYGDEYYNSRAGSAFSSLTFLQLFNMPNLEEWLVPEGAAAFPCLAKLELWGCPKLTVQPHLPSSILDLSIDSCNEELLEAEGSLQGLSTLRCLRIEFMGASKSGWEGLKHLTALEELEVFHCARLTCLPEGIMTLRCLQSLSIYRSDNLKSLKKGRGRELPLFFTTLRHLQIVNCPALTELPEWLGCLTSLQSLVCRECPRLALLPDGMEHLTSLQELRILRCPILEQWCQREGGEYWQKISHIPDIEIGGTRFCRA